MKENMEMLEKVKDLVSLKQALVSKEKRDKSATVWELQVDNRVLLRTPGLDGKLVDS